MIVSNDIDEIVKLFSEVVSSEPSESLTVALNHQERRWITFQDLMERWGAVEFEVIDNCLAGLLPVNTRTGEYFPFMGGFVGPAITRGLTLDERKQALLEVFTREPTCHYVRWRLEDVEAYEQHLQTNGDLTDRIGNAIRESTGLDRVALFVLGLRMIGKTNAEVVGLMTASGEPWEGRTYGVAPGSGKTQVSRSFDKGLKYLLAGQHITEEEAQVLRDKYRSSPQKKENVTP